MPWLVDVVAFGLKRLLDVCTVPVQKVRFVAMGLVVGRERRAATIELLGLGLGLGLALALGLGLGLVGLGLGLRLGLVLRVVTSVRGRVHGSVCSLPFLPTRPAGGDASSWRLMSKVPQRSRTSSQLAHAQSLGRFRSSLGRAADRGKLDGGAPSSKRFAKR